MNYLQSKDGSFSLYNEEYKDYYHSLKDGAILESLYKHIIPTFFLQKSNDFKILDICFGLGYNALFSLLYAKRLACRVKIYSVEKDIVLLEKLKTFAYPKILQNNFSIQSILQSRIFSYHNSTLSLFCGDALEYIRCFSPLSFDIIYQDAFSPTKNNELWSEDYFRQLYILLRNDGVISTYSSSQKIRKICAKCGFCVYDMQCGILKNGTLFSKQELNNNKIECINFLRLY